MWFLHIIVHIVYGFVVGTKFNVNMVIKKLCFEKEEIFMFKKFHLSHFEIQKHIKKHETQFDVNLEMHNTNLC
jgi:hypothetical protein